MHRSKFNKKKCANCMYHRKIHAGNVHGIMCNYASVCDATCLHVVKGRVEDRRGSEYDSCKLYMAGEPIVRQYKTVY